jgi:NosR/NirI family nitrous oxide reductase transcriptional regulator
MPFVRHAGKLDSLSNHSDRSRLVGFGHGQNHRWGYPRSLPMNYIDRMKSVCRYAFCAFFMAVAFASPTLAEKGKLRDRLTPAVMAVVFPNAERLGAEDGSPPAIAVYRGGKVVGYVFSTLDIVAALGYSATPFDVIAGVDLSGRISGAKVVFHNEPYILNDARRERLLDTFLAREAGRPLRGNTDKLPPDFVAGATISARAMRAAVEASAKLVLRARGAGGIVTTPTLDADAFNVMSWDELLASGAVIRRRVTSGEVAAAFAKAGASGIALDVPPGKPDDLYAEIMTGLFTPRSIGGNLLGLQSFEEYMRVMPIGAQVIIVAANGPYQLFDPKYRSADGRRFDRLRVVQDGQIIDVARDGFRRLRTSSGGGGIRGQQEAALFALAPESGFDPIKPWRLELLVNGTGAQPSTIAFDVDYKIPEAHILTPDPPPTPIWVEAWKDSRLNIAILALLLVALTLIFVFQATLARFRLAHRVVRTAFLMIVLVWLGWTAGVQLSIVNVINYLRAPFGGIEAGFFLAEPLMVMVALYTLISVILIGRGVFCGWLCPFGALQELLGQISRAIGVPQWQPPPALEKRLWWGKYVAAAIVLALVLTAMDPTGASTEIEPFKTAIISKFTRAWPYVLYAGILLAIGLFSERAYCRFLCPLGGVLAALDRLHLIDLLKRRPECGNPCHLCERSCPVRAIEPTGKIVTAECFQCLDCQVEYYDDARCPPLVRAAKLRNVPKPAAVMVENA